MRINRMLHDRPLKRGGVMPVPLLKFPPTQTICFLDDTDKQNRLPLRCTFLGPCGDSANVWVIDENGEKVKMTDLTFCENYTPARGD